MKSHLLFIVGSTATGKSDLAVTISEQARGAHRNFSQDSDIEIINSDSVSFYEAVQIGAAKPGPDLLARAPHHLVGHVLKNQKYTAGDFRRDALKILKPNHSYIIVGGSGFYVQALEKGMYDTPKIPAEIRESLAREADEPEGLAKLYNELKERDSESIQKILAPDRYRILRALEVLRSDTRGFTLSQIKAEFDRVRPEAPFTNRKIGLFRPRDVLREKVTERTEKMLSSGLIEEVEALSAEGLGLWSPMLSVGYKEVQAYLRGELEKGALLGAIVTSTMQLAKQQSTWFHRDPEIQWFDSDSQMDEAIQAGLNALAEMNDLQVD